MVNPHNSGDPLSLQIRQSDRGTPPTVPVNFLLPWVFGLFFHPRLSSARKTLRHGVLNYLRRAPSSLSLALTDSLYLTRGGLTSVGRPRWRGGGELPLIVVLSDQRWTPNLTWLSRLAAYPAGLPLRKGRGGGGLNTESQKYRQYTRVHENTRARVKPASTTADVHF